MEIPDRELKMLGTFWDFLAYLERYVELVRDMAPVEADPARTLLLSTLTECLRPVLRADVALIGYREMEGDSGEWLQIIKEASKIGRDIRQSPLIRRMEELKWRLPSDQLAMVESGHPVMFFDQGLEELPEVFQGVITVLAVSRVTMAEREYYLLFCDIEEHEEDLPRYNSFDRTMLMVATGLLEIGFLSGVRTGREL